jgi:putative ABC transport system permease protein
VKLVFEGLFRSSCTLQKALTMGVNIFKPVGMGEVFGGQVAVMDIYAAQRAFNRGHSIDRIDLSHDPNVPIETVQQRLRERLPAGVDVARPSARGQQIENAINAIQTGLTITSFLALTIGVFIIFNSFSSTLTSVGKRLGSCEPSASRASMYSGCFSARRL